MDQKQQIADRLKQANNILVTVSNNPSVDQLASCIGLTLALNKMGKHATALFSGVVPSTIEFLQPEKTFESDVDALRDFIISLDKTKADKLRYKVEDKVVKIFITPYRTSLSDKDLEFSQGDFNVEVVVALGVHSQAELDQAITSHGRILHDATVASLNVKPGAELGTLNWLAQKASSLSELVVQLIDTIDKKTVDAQIATALLTGIVAETKRFSNEKTSPATMSISAELMAAGANQQLVVTKLEEAAPAPEPTHTEVPLAEAGVGGDIALSAPSGGGGASVNGTLEITHAQEQPEPPKPEEEAKPPEEEKPMATLEDLAGPDNSDKEAEKKEDETPRIHIDSQGGLHNVEGAGGEHNGDGTTDPTQHVGGSRMILQPPSMGGAMSASGSQEDSYGDPLSTPRSSNPFDAQPSGSPASFGSPASANISAPSTPYMPPSMTPGPSPFGPPPGSPALAAPSGSPAPSPFDRPAPGNAPAVAPSPPADLVASNASASGSGFTVPEPHDAAHVDTARDAVSQALGYPTAAPQPLSAPPSPAAAIPPDLTPFTPTPVLQPPSIDLPAPMGSPPPVPPPMMPQSPQ